ncbi:MAG: monofunctional biosynthetic peptidoglycan transglycosylase [Bacteroidaceae bacterium]|nr:monofunctional biosynthetic peptidoglycan transglycosylase [Bacteroidaceae bacterium]MBR1789672.1 monofunctional biosynthetic peptidoglycan transglycosylase [Bacteroidaceae bacterium]
MLKKLQKFLRWIVLLFFGSTILSVFLLRWCPVYVTPLMFIRCGQQVWRGEKIRLHHHWVPMAEMAEPLPLAVMASEDQRFLEHHGFDFGEIGKAVEDYRRGKRQRGASTISQQTAKNVFLWPGHSWLRKGLEVYFTGLIELIWGKQRIMEVYLNSIEMGDGIYGAEAVSQLHFGYPARDLTRANCALVAATLPNPLKYSSEHPSAYMLKRQTWIMGQMRYLEKHMDLETLRK